MKLRELGRGIRFGSMAVGLLFVAFALRAALMPAQNDTWWHLRAGEDIWRSGQVPRFDHYSHTFAGAPWPDHEWLSQALMFGVYRFGGMPGLELGAMVLVMGAAVLTWRLMAGPLGLRAALMSTGLAISSCVWVLRPHVLTLFLLALLLTLLVRERWRWIPPLFILWANAHGGVVLGGLALAAAWAAAALRWWRVREAADARRVRALTVVAALSGLACAAAPLGFGIYRFVIESTARSMQVKIVEWFPVAPTDFFGVMFWAATLGFVVLVIARRRMFLGRPAAPWSDWVIVAVALATLPLAARSVRNTAPFILFAVPAASRLCGASFRLPAAVSRLFRRKPRPASPDKPRLNLAILTGMGALAVAIVGLAYATNHGSLAWRPIGDGALAAARSCEGPLYNKYGDGGTLIWFLPEKPVFVDGRQDPYPMPFLLEVVAVEGGEAPYQPLFERWKIRCAFLPAEEKLVGALGRDGWNTRFRDDKYVVLEAPPRR